jgi:hypothetical protein
MSKNRIAFFILVFSLFGSEKNTTTPSSIINYGSAVSGISELSKQWGVW